LELRYVQGLRDLCKELSSVQPAPGGGSASAAAGALSASLLLMVCKISRKAKSREAAWGELDELAVMLGEAREELVALTGHDAAAYERLAAALRERGTQVDTANVDKLEGALRHAAEVPARTATVCATLLEHSVRVAEIGVRSARSDVGVAIVLADAGLRGAVMNVQVNLSDMKDRDYAQRMEDEMGSLRRRAEGWVVEALKLVGQ